MYKSFQGILRPGEVDRAGSTDQIVVITLKWGLEGEMISTAAAICAVLRGADVVAS